MTTTFSEKLSEFQDLLSYRFREPRLLQQALTHKSFAYESESTVHNESMELLGDSVLGFLVTDFVYHFFPALTEGRKSKIKAYLVSSRTLSAIALDIGIPRYLRLGKGEEKTGGRSKKALAANAFEAVVAAIYLDASIEQARGFLSPLYKPLLIDIQEGRAAVEDPKTALQEYLQARNLGSAQYSVTAETGPEHRKTFHIVVRVGQRMLGEASGKTKKRAELQAAEAALAELTEEARTAS